MFPTGSGSQQGTNTELQESGKSGETWGADPLGCRKSLSSVTCGEVEIRYFGSTDKIQ